MEPKQIKSEVKRLFTTGVWNEVRKSYGIPFMDFFEFYRRLVTFSLSDGEIGDPDLRQQYKEAVRNLLRTKPDPLVRNMVARLTPGILKLLSELRKEPNSARANRFLRIIFGRLIPEILRDRDIFVKPRGIASTQWIRFLKMAPHEIKIEKIMDSDPQLGHLLQTYGERVSEIESRIQNHIERGGFTSERKRLMGRVVQIAKDPVTGEELAYDLFHNGVPIDEYKRIRNHENRVIERLAKEEGTLSKIMEASMVPLSIVDHLPGAPTFSSITDDLSKSNRLNRIYPVKEYDGRKVVVAGRYKGLYLDSLVNILGRQIEGTTSHYNENLNRPETTTLTKKGKESIVALREPYITKSTRKKDSKLFVKIPWGSEYTEVRNALFDVARVYPSVEYVEGSRRSEFYFEPRDFEMVRNALQGVAMSSAASQVLQSYFKNLAKEELATARKNLHNYTMRAIGGFKKTLKGERPKLLVKQQQALAWLDIRGDNGLCALETGLGKTMVAIASMQKLKRDEVLTEDGRVLFVCPRSLQGNLFKEMAIYLSEDAYQWLKSRVDIMSYNKFSRSNPKTLEKSYVAIYFDEAHKMLPRGKNRTAIPKTLRNALKMNHPRKVLLTASPVEKEPVDSYILAAITNNVDLTPSKRGKPPNPERQKMYQFQRTYTEVIGGRSIGVKQDPSVQRDLRTWVKRNVFYADKMDVEEYLLPSLTKQVMTVSMNPEIETRYRKIIGRARETLEKIIRLYSLAGTEVDRRKIRGLTKETLAEFYGRKFGRDVIKPLMELTNHPDQIPGVKSNPKISLACDIVAQSWASSHQRTILFTDDKSLITKTAQTLSEKLPGLYHLAGLPTEIRVYRDGSLLSEFESHKLPFQKREYKRFPNEPAHSDRNRHFRKHEWQVFVLSQIVSPNPMFATVTLHGQEYAEGQNLQAFSQVIHLDRNDWNAQIMKQRVSRAWRQGQQAPVTEVTIDTVYAQPGDIEFTLDDVRALIQQVDDKLFQDFIREAQKTALGSEYFEMDRLQSSKFHTDRKLFELALSPFTDHQDRI